MTARLAMVAVLLVFGACGGGDDDPPTAASPQPTATAGGDALQPTATAPQATPTATAESTTMPSITRPESPECGVGEPKNQPPSDIVVLPGATLYASGGMRFDAAIDGTAVADTRDAAARALEEAGFSLRSTGEEKDAAVASLEGPDRRVEVQVAPLCAGRLRVTYLLSS